MKKKVQSPSRKKPALVKVPLTGDDLDAICQDIVSELHSDAPFFSSVSADDYRAVLNAWREHSPRYVEAKLRRNRIQGEKSSRETFEEFRACHDASADRLERLLPYLEAASVAA